MRTYCIVSTGIVRTDTAIHVLNYIITPHIEIVKHFCKKFSYFFVKNTESFQQFSTYAFLHHLGIVGIVDCGFRGNDTVLIHL